MQYWSNTPTWDPSTGQYLNQWTQTTELDPDMQASLESQQNLTKNRSDLGNQLFPRAQEEFGEAMDWSKFDKGGGAVDPTELQTKIDSGQKYYDKAGDAVYNAFDARMAPRFQRENAQLDATLRARGMKPGDEAYNQALADARMSQNDAYQQAQSQAVQMSGAEAQRMQGMDTNAAQFGNTAQQQKYNQQMQSSSYQNTLRQQQIAEEMQKRGFSLNEINALISGQQVGMPSMPGFSQAAASQPVQYMQAAQGEYQANKDKADAQNAMMGDIAGAAGMFAMM